MFPLYDGQYLSPEAFHNWSRNSLQNFRKSQMMPDQVRKWMDNSQNLYAVGFDELVKRWDKCISVGGGYVEK
jgi:hypothetical protein